MLRRSCVRGLPIRYPWPTYRSLRQPSAAQCEIWNVVRDSSQIASSEPSCLRIGAWIAAVMLALAGAREVHCLEGSGLCLSDEDRKRSCRRKNSIPKAFHCNGTHSGAAGVSEDYTLVFGSEDDYTLLGPLGKGAHSEVFEAVRLHNSQRVAATNGEWCVIKKLKSAKERRIIREVRILEHLRGGPNIIGLLDVVKTDKEASLVFEHGHFVDFKSAFKTLEDDEVRFYIYEILRALDYCHSRGIMHRDVKPRNVVVNLESKQVRLIDFGLADFFQTGKEYSLRVSSLRYKAPELLVGQVRYDYSVDVWSMGCMLADIVFRKEPFFCGKDNTDQLAKIVNVLGTEDLFAYLAKHRLQLDYHFSSHLRRQPRRSLYQFVTDDNCDLAVPLVVDLIEKMLVYDPEFRISPKEAMSHPYFRSVRERARADSG